MINTFPQRVKSFFVAAHTFILPACSLPLSLSLSLTLTHTHTYRHTHSHTQTVIGHMCKLRLGRNRGICMQSRRRRLHARLGSIRLAVRSGNDRDTERSSEVLTQNVFFAITKLLKQHFHWNDSVPSFLIHINGWSLYQLLALYRLCFYVKDHLPEIKLLRPRGNVSVRYAERNLNDLAVWPSYPPPLYFIRGHRRRHVPLRPQTDG